MPTTLSRIQEAGKQLSTTGKHFAQNAISKKGKPMTEIHLRPWQSEAIKKALDWLVVKQTDSRFLLNVAPGAGKTICACVIAKELIKQNEIERVVVIAPRREVVNQWGKEFHNVTGRYMSKADGEDISGSGTDICATWHAIENLQDGFQSLCRKHETLVICDEYHHAAIDAAWGTGANKSFENAKYRILLSGTPIRTDGAQTVAHNDKGEEVKIDKGGTYSLTYGEAVNLKYCRPATFHRHEGIFNVVLPDEAKITVSSQSTDSLPDGYGRIEGLKEAVNFYKLACTAKYTDDAELPDIHSYQATMLQAGQAKLDEARQILHNAGGLVIACNIKMAEYMKKLLEMMGENPLIVHSETRNPDDKIAQFKNTDTRWIVSVGMISEGVDIPRLRVLVYLPYSQTELTFRQSMGRIVRTFGHEDISHAYVVMPSIATFEDYAFRVEEEMRAVGIQIEMSNLKVCPQCQHQCDKKATKCDECGYEFPTAPMAFKECRQCGMQNVLTAKTCAHCGCEFTQHVPFELTLKDALRDGAIIRGMYIDEDTVQRGEEIEEDFRNRVIASGNPALLHLIHTLPPEAYGVLAAIFERINKE